jgi:CMP-N-acetylneuraminic acid synthetase
MKVLITICGRGGSKGIPGKNIKLLNNIPLIAYTIKHAFQFCNLFDADIALSTDSDSIKKIASDYKLNTIYNRPFNLSTDNISKKDTITDVLFYYEKLNKLEYDIILDLDITSPLRTLNDLLSAYNLLINDPKCVNIFSVSSSNKNPYFNMVEKKNNGYFGLIKEGNYFTRQSTPKVFDLNASFYFYKRNYFINNNLKTINEYSLIYEMPHICFDLDHNIDFQFMEYLLKNNLLNFEL